MRRVQTWFGVIFVIAIIGINLWSYEWQVRLPGSTGAMALDVDGDIQTLTLITSTREDSELSVRTDGGTTLPCKLSSAHPATPGCTRQSVDGRDQIVIALPVAVAGVHRKVILLAEETQSQDDLVFKAPPALLSFAEVRWQRASNKEYAETARACVFRRGPSCRSAEQILGRPLLNAHWDVQPLMVLFARYVLSRAVPIVILLMLIWDAYLLACCVSYARKMRQGAAYGRACARKLRRQHHRSGQAPSVAVPLHIDHLEIPWRRLLEWSEVTGPALGFLLTVGALLLAFEPAIFQERDTARFTESLSMAMTATFAGLLMRIGAFSADRLLEHLLRKSANELGFIEETEK